VQERDAPGRPKPGERRLELERLVERRAHERLDEILAPRLERARSEPAREALGAREADAGDLDGGTVTPPSSVRICTTSGATPDSKSWLPSTATFGSFVAASSFARTFASSAVP
jgi:hypothetical protein